MARAREPWFDYLLRNKAVRTFLNNYAEPDWQEVSKLTIIYGIINLGFWDGKAIVPLEKLRDIVANSARAVTVQKAIPSLNDQLEGLRMQLDDVVLDIQKGEREQPSKLQIPHRDAVEAVPDVPTLPSGQASDQQRADVAAANVSLRHAEKWLRYKGHGLAIDPQDMPAKVLDRAAAAEVAQRALSPGGLPASGWRTGDRSRTYSPPGKKRSPVMPGDGLQGAEYPSWWGDGEDWCSGNSSVGGANAQASPGRDGVRTRSAPRQGRRPTRLAYSVQLEPQASQGQPIWKNDLVTSRYVDVPSSGYGRATSPPRAPQHYMPPPPLPQPSYGFAPGPYPMVGVPNVQPGVSGPFQAPYGQENPYRSGGPGPQLYMVQPTGAVAPVNGPAEAAAMWDPPPQPMRQQADQRQQQQQQQGSGTDRPAWKPIRTAKITSRIRDQVQADRLAARARREARQRAAEAAVAPPRLRSQQPQGGWSPNASLKSPSGPAEVANSLASNPFMAWFITPPQAQQQDPQPQHQQVQVQRPTTPKSQQQGQQQSQQVPWGEPLYAGAEPQHGPEQRGPSAPGTDGATSSSFQSWPTTPRHGPSPGPAASAGGMAVPPGDASLTFYPRVPAAGIPGGQLQIGAAYPAVTSATASLAPPSYNPYGGRQYRDPGLYQTRRVAWADSPQTQPSSTPNWLSSPTAWERPWPRNQAPSQHQQSPQPPPNQPQRSLAGQWLAGQPAAWSAMVTGNTMAAGAGYGWGGQIGSLGAGLGPWTLTNQPAQASPRAEALKSVRPEVVKWSKSWVGDFGHLDGKRFPPSEPVKYGAGRMPTISDDNKACGSSDGVSLAADGAAASCPTATSEDGQVDKVRSADASGGGALGGSTSASVALYEGASNGGAVSIGARPAEQPWRYPPPEHLQGLAPALAAADALLAAAASSNEGRGLYGAESAIAARAASGQGSQQSGSLGGHLPGERAWEMAVRTAGSDRAGSGATSSGYGAAGVAAQERAWSRVLGQVSRLANMSELEINSSMRPSAEEEGAAEQQGGPDISLSTGGVKWDFDKIVGSPKGLTYQ